MGRTRRAVERLRELAQLQQHWAWKNYFELIFEAEVVLAVRKHLVFEAGVFDFVSVG